MFKLVFFHALLHITKYDLKFPLKENEFHRYSPSAFDTAIEHDDL